MFLVLFLMRLSIVVGSAENPQLEINNGKIEGTIMTSAEGRNFFAFRGVPFAEPPLGPLRFKSPVPKKPWKEVLDATKPHAICPQKAVFGKVRIAEGVEDCLFLNVYTPQLPSVDREPLPVMVFFHGGGFFTGSGDYSHYGPEMLLDQDIVLVIGNYRLGALGFLSTDDEVSPGNYGLKDQSLLLKWINQNIEHFGGDPRNVTLFGQSAGGASGHFHMLSPLSRGLFKGVISQSGTIFNCWAVAPKGENIKNAKILAESVNCSTSSSRDLVDCLRNVDPLVLVDQDVKFMEWNREPIMPFKPVVEPPSSGAFLIDTPHNLFKSGIFADVPLMLGMTTKEALIQAVDFLERPSLIEDLNKDFNYKAALSLNYKQYVEDIDVIGDKIKKFYFGDEKLEAQKSFPALTEMYTDAWFTSGLDEAMRIFRRVSKFPMFNYVFEHNGPLSLTSTLISTEEFYGSGHGDDLIFQFPNYTGLYTNREYSEDDRKFTKFFTTLWANFARTGNPTPEINDIIKRRWEPVASDKLEYYYIRPNLHEMRDGLFEERVKFWRNLPFRTRNFQKDEL